jgi:iron complex outermembrane receptor protein
MAAQRDPTCRPQWKAQLHPVARPDRYRREATSLKVALGASAFWDKSDVQAAQLIQVNPLMPPFVDPRLGTQPLVTSDARVGDWTAGMNPKRDDRQWHVNGRIDYELSDAITLTALTSYADYRQDRRARSRWRPRWCWLTRCDTGTITAFYQELRLSGRIRPRQPLDRRGELREQQGQ